MNDNLYCTCKYYAFDVSESFWNLNYDLSLEHYKNIAFKAKHIKDVNGDDQQVRNAPSLYNKTLWEPLLSNLWINY
jgi:hypothetical protein